MNVSTLKFADSAPYPLVNTDGRNMQYAFAMLSNIGSCDSEMTAVSLYFYNRLILQATHPDISECLHHIGIVEMRHMEIFGQLALSLGAEPRMWSQNKGRMYYWSPACNYYPQAIIPILNNLISGEETAIQTYRKQAGWIKDSCTAACLERIIKDEEIHLAILQELLKEQCT